MRSSRARTGFTLVELLVVMSIIALLIGLLVPAVSRALLSVRSQQTRQVLKDLAAGLEMFRDDFGGYPPSFETRGQSRRHIFGTASDNKWYGNENLCYYLTGPDMEGWGTPAGGRKPFGGLAERKYGPYYQGRDTSFGYNTNTQRREVILDAFPQDPKPIFYFVVDASNNVNAADCPFYDKNVADSYGFGDQAQFNRSKTHGSGSISGKPYLLISAGEDRWYGEVVQDTTTKELRPWKASDTTAKAEYDDITNFE